MKPLPIQEDHDVFYEFFVDCELAAEIFFMQ